MIISQKPNSSVYLCICLHTIIVFFFNSHSQVMLAASYWSLLAPAIEMAEESGKYGAFAFLPVAIGFVIGAAFVYFADLMMPFLVSGFIFSFDIQINSFHLHLH